MTEEIFNKELKYEVLLDNTKRMKFSELLQGLLEQDSQKKNISNKANNLHKVVFFKKGFDYSVDKTAVWLFNSANSNNSNWCVAETPLWADIYKIWENWSGKPNLIQELMDFYNTNRFMDFVNVSYEQEKDKENGK